MDLDVFRFYHGLNYYAKNLLISVFYFLVNLFLDHHLWFVLWYNLAVDFLENILFALRLLLDKLEKRFVLSLGTAIRAIRNGVAVCLIFD